jgi:hypothetical protein
MKRLAVAIAIVLAVTDAVAPTKADSREMGNAEVVEALSRLAAETATLHADISAMATDHSRESAAVSAGLVEVATAMRDLSRSIEERERAQAERERARWPR